VSAAIFTQQSPKDDACCKHTQTVVKVNDSHEQVLQAWYSNIIFSLEHHITLSTEYAAAFLQASNLDNNLINGPPLSSWSIPLYIQNCAYRI